jgi:hypothetical protein
MVFNKFKSSSNKAPLYSVNASKTNDLSSAKVQSFKEKLQRINPDAAWLRNFTPATGTCNIDNNSEISLSKLHNITFSYMDTVDITSIECVEHFSVYYESLRISTDKCIQVEIATRDQQANPFWEHCKKKNKH